MGYLWSVSTSTGCLAGAQAFTSDRTQECYQPTSANPAYRLTFWLDVEPNFDGRGATTRKNFAMAAGLEGQRLYLLFDVATVVVRLGPLGGRTFQDVALLEALLLDFFRQTLRGPEGRFAHCLRGA